MMDERRGETMARLTPEAQSGTTEQVTGPAPVAGDFGPVSENVIFLEPGQEKAQNIARAIAHQNAGDVMHLLSTEGPLRLSDIADRLGMSINATKYHIGNLMNAGLLEISNTQYSVKGRKVNVYRLKNQIFIVAPTKSGIFDLRSVLMKYVSALGIFIFVFGSTLLQPFVPLPAIPLRLAGSIQPGQPAVVMTDGGVIPALIIAVAATLLILVMYEVITNRKSRNETLP